MECAAYAVGDCKCLRGLRVETGDTEIAGGRERIQTEYTVLKTLCLWGVWENPKKS
jgi:hypothetical protein